MDAFTGGEFKQYRKLSMLRFVSIFLVVLVSLFLIELLPWGQNYVVIPFTEIVADLSALVIQWFDQGITSQGKVLYDSHSGFAVSIESGCNGIEATIVLIAAIVAYPSSWRMKLKGLGFGFVAVQAANLIRIISLFYLGQWSKIAFEWAHLYIWQSLIILDVLLVFLIWLRYVPRKDFTGVSTPA
jgi:exosortase H (IPTLxxWG-CTERM-specific)